jgi:hypothetical protein
MKTKTASKTLWEKVGVVGVDSGQLMVCDPCYIDGEWKRDQEPPGHDVYILNANGRKKFPKLKRWRWQFGYHGSSGSYADVQPELGMSINDACATGLLEEVVRQPSREFSYKGACDVSRCSGSGFGQLEFPAGHAGAGVAFSSGYGDGVYDVFARRNRAGRIVEVRVVMNPTPAQIKALGL